MPHRLYDYKCNACATESEHLTWNDSESPVPLRRVLHCRACDRRVGHRRIVSLPAPYTGEQVHNVRVFGSDQDTMGFRAPDMPMPRPKEEKAPGDVLHHDVMREHFASKEWTAWTAEAKARDGENAIKRKRAKAIKAGAPINMRRDKAPGDPKL